MKNTILILKTFFDKHAQANKILYAVIIGLIILFVVLLIFVKARSSGVSAIDSLRDSFW